jgi:hypothetical protein
MAALTTATKARREGRKFVKAVYARNGIAITEQQARTFWSTGLRPREYVALREFFGLDAAPAPQARKARAAKPVAKTQVSVTTSTTKDLQWYVRSAPECSSAWIDPKGTFYAVKDCGHHEFSMVAGPVVKAEYSNGTYITGLEQKGWLHLSFGTIRNLYRGAFGAASACSVTPQQYDTLMATVKVYEDNGYQYAGVLRNDMARLS